MITNTVTAVRRSQSARFHRSMAWGISMLVVAVTFGLLPAARAQIDAFDFTGQSSPATSTPTVYGPNLDGLGTLTRGSTAASSTASNSFRTQGFGNDGISTSNTDYFQFTLSAAAGYTLSLTSISAKYAGTSTYYASPGATTQFAYSLDGTTFTLIGTAQTITSTNLATAPAISLTGISALQNVVDTATVYFRFYASGQTTTGGFGFTSPSAGSYGLAVAGSTNATGVTNYLYFDTNGTAAGSGVTNGGTYTFSGSNFNTAANGTGAVGAFTSGQTATFAAGTDAGTSNYTVNIDTAVTTLGLTFTSGNATLAPGGGSLTLTGSAVDVASGLSATISQAIGGTVGLNKTDTGTLTLSGTNTYTGGTTVSGGILAISADANLGDTAGGVVMAGGTLRATANASLAATRALSGTGSLEAVAGSTLTFNGSVSTTAVTISNTGTVATAGTGVTTKSIGNVTFSAAGTLANSGDTLAVGSVTTTTGSTGVATISGPISLATGTHTFTVVDGNASGVDLAINGAISGVGSISKPSGAGTLALNGDNSAYTGTFSLGSTAASGGTVSVGSANAFGTGTTAIQFNTVTVSNDSGSTLTFAKGISFGATTAGTGATLAGSPMVFTGGVSLYKGASGTTAQESIVVNNSTTFSGTFGTSTGAGTSTGLTIGGTGTLTLSGNNTFVEPVVVTGATLVAAGTGANLALGGTALVTVGNAGTVQMGAVNQFNATTPAGVTLNGGTTGGAFFKVAGFSQGSTTGAGVGALTLATGSAGNRIDFGGLAGVLSAASFVPNSTVGVTGYLDNAGAAGGPDQLIFTTDPSAGLSSIYFEGYVGVGETQLSSGLYEVYPITAVPEPTTVLGGALLIAAAGWSQRRRWRGALAA